MQTYTIVLKNIDARIDDMRLPKGEQATVRIIAEDASTAQMKAVRKFFPGMGLQPENIQTSDGTRYFQLLHKNSLYGRIRVHVSE